MSTKEKYERDFQRTKETAALLGEAPCCDGYYKFNSQIDAMAFRYIIFNENGALLRYPFFEKGRWVTYVI